MTNENGIFTLEVTKSGEMFDYDMQIKAKTDAKMAKMIRFFEYGAKYLVFFSSRSLKTREKCISFAQFVYFLREVCLSFKNWKVNILSSKNIQTEQN